MKIMIEVEFVLKQGWHLETRGSTRLAVNDADPSETESLEAWDVVEGMTNCIIRPRPDRGQGWESTGLSIQGYSLDH